MKTTQLVRKFRLDAVDAASYNPRSITDAAKLGLQQSLAAYGVLELPVVNVHGGKKVLISGHQRMAALKAAGYAHVDCVVVDFDLLKEKMANIAMNNHATQGKFDAARAMPEIQRMLAKMGDPNVAGFAALLDSVKAGVSKLEAKDDDESAPADLQDEVPVSVIGATYRLGRHSVFCGEMAAGAKVLLGKQQAAMCVTDPPYNVGFEADVWSTRKAMRKLGDGETVPATKGEIVANDDIPPEQWRVMAASWFGTIAAYTSGPVVTFYAARMSPDTLHAFGASCDLAWMGLWVKDIPSVSPLVRKGVDYHYQTEPFLLGWRPGAKVAEPERCWNVVRCPRQRRNRWHPTEKPVALMKTFIVRHSAEGDIVYDPFLGSGSTLMACEEAGRICVGSELSQVYCDRIRKRWAQAVHGADCDWCALTQPA